MDRRVIRKQLRDLEKRTRPSQGTSRATLPNTPPSDDAAHGVPSGGLGSPAEGVLRPPGPGSPEPPGLPDEAAPLPETDPGQTSAEERTIEVVPLPGCNHSAQSWYLDGSRMGCSDCDDEEPTPAENLDRFMTELDAAKCKRCGYLPSSCSCSGEPSIQLPDTGRVTGATLRRGDVVESITLDELIDVDTKISLALDPLTEAGIRLGVPPHRMDAPDGPVCGCGRPSVHESGWCGVLKCGYPEDFALAAHDPPPVLSDSVMVFERPAPAALLPKMGFPIPPFDEGGDANARHRDTRTAVHVAQTEADSTSVSVVAIEQPPAHVLASLPQPGDVYDHLFSQLSERTREAYEGDLSALAEWLQLSSSRAAVGYFLAQPPERAQAIALGWLDQMQGQTPPLAPATQSRRLAALRSVLKVARGLGVVSWTLNVKAPKAASLRDTDGFDVDTAKKLLAACGEGLFGLRNQVLMRLLYVHALRRVEVTRILTKHFDGRRILVHGKGFERDERKIKFVTLTPKEAELVTRWVSEAKRQPDQQLLCGWRNGQPTESITGHGVYAVALQLHKRAGVRVGTRPHQFRHSAVNELIDRGVSLTIAQSLLRHEDPRTTSGYYSNREDAALQASTMLEKILDGEEEEPKE